MMEIFLLQLLSIALGGLSTAWAGRCYHRARIGGRLHAFWVSSSTAAICLPVVAWTAIIFFGPGLLGQSISGTLVGAIFLWVYRNLPYPRPVATSSLSRWHHQLGGSWGTCGDGSG
jgi:hypothetical protein